jgi:hypothetical protein
LHLYITDSLKRKPRSGKRAESRRGGEKKSKKVSRREKNIKRIRII